jgi:hypothetical protein
MEVLPLALHLRGMKTRRQALMRDASYPRLSLLEALRQHHLLMLVRQLCLNIAASLTICCQH